LKNKDKDKLLFKKNEIFKRLDKLMNSYNEKIDKGRKVLKMEENVNNLWHTGLPQR